MTKKITESSEAREAKKQASVPSLDGLIMDAIGAQTFDQLLREATRTVEQELAIEDRGWIWLSATSGRTISPEKRIESVKQSRLYYSLDPLARQSIRLWTDYTFGAGMSWSVNEENKATKELLEKFWKSRDNAPVFGARGQRKSSDRLLVDGEIFFAVFLGSKEATVRVINPLEISEIITDKDDIEKPLYYKREWTDAQAGVHSKYYRSWLNVADIGAVDSLGANIKQTEDAIIYHLPINTIEQRGNPLLLPALDWIKQYRRFLAARVGMMLARTRFAWQQKVQGGAAAVATAKAVTDAKTPVAGSTWVENEAADLKALQTPQDARNAYDDLRALKLQVFASVGIPEQYYSDISTGNLATAKTVELPMLKMFQSYQAVWADAYQDIFELVLEHNKIPHYGKENVDLWYVDKDFPTIAPEDAFAAAQAIVQIVTAFPDFALLSDVQQQALLALGINDPAQVLEELQKLEKSEESNVSVKLARVLREFRRFMEAK